GVGQGACAFRKQLLARPIVERPIGDRHVVPPVGELSSSRRQPLSSKSHSAENGLHFQFASNKLHNELNLWLIYLASAWCSGLPAASLLIRPLSLRGCSCSRALKCKWL